MRRGGPPLPPPPMAQLPVVSSPSPLHHRPWRSCLSCRRRRAAARSTAACHVIAIAPPPVAQLPVMSSPSRYYPSRSCDHTAAHRIAVTFVACRATVVLQTEPGTWGLHRGGEARKKRERKNSQLTFSSGALLPSYMEGRSAGVSLSDVKKRKRKDVTYGRWWRWRWCTGTGISMSWVARGLSTWGGAVHGGAA